MMESQLRALQEGKKGQFRQMLLRKWVESTCQSVPWTPIDIPWAFGDLDKINLFSVLEENQIRVG
jgi:hypothetical protein